ncbi:flagellar hook-associated protein FlgK [Desulfobacula sp.]|uniref:flagellar hook-associated protein FlgK n=1 Tax=Desulfobacula sp. TaxID=2593537 RepID=UPI0026165A75|nr:flagellar hook-associated protein FlgK [Desulfobacula sp.]
MAGIISTLSIAKTAIASQQYGLNITGQNIANVNNPDYSVQNADQKSMKPALYSGFLFGTGVDTYQVRQSVDQLIEDQLTNELSTQASFEEQESYMRILEGYFDESADTSLSNVMTEFWNSWHDLSNNPKGSAERAAVLENGNILATTFQSTVSEMDGLVQDITSDIDAAIVQINTVTSQIAALNQDIMSSEIGRNANDLRDERNRLTDELGQLININSFEQSNGSLIVNVANGLSIVNGVEAHTLAHVDKKIVWNGSTGSQTDISDKIDGGRISGFLEMRDDIIPTYRSEINDLSREMIWAMNYQASQGVGLAYFSEPVIGDYATDDTGWFSSFEFGDKIDTAQDFVMWMEDKTDAQAQYTKISMDMDISQATISNWQGGTPGAVQSIYSLTVVEDAVLGDQVVTESDGDGLAIVQGLVLGSGAATTVSMALDTAIAEQTLTVYDGPSGTGIVTVADAGGDAKRSAASIAAALNRLDGVEAHASDTTASFDTAGIVNAQEGDTVSFSLYVDGIVLQQTFTRDPARGTLQKQFEEALLSAGEAINTINEDDDLFVDGLSITSQSGRTLGVQDFAVQANAGVSLTDFFNFDGGDTVSFTMDAMAGSSVTDSIAVSVNLLGVDPSDQAQMALAFSDALSTALEGKSFTVENDLSTNTVLVRTTDGSDIRLRDAGNEIGNDATITLAEVAGTTADAGNAGGTTLDFTVAATDTARYNATPTTTDTLGFSGNGTGVTLHESAAGAVNKTGVITGTVTVLLEPGMSVQSTVFGAGSGGLFDSQLAKKGSSILTLGGEGGFSNFTAGETLSFDLDGTPIDFTIGSAAGSTTDIELAKALETALNNDLAAGGVGADYQVIRTGTAVSVIKDVSLEDPIRITDFTETNGLGEGNNATLAVRTGTGQSAHPPETDLLESGNPARNFTTSSLYHDQGTLLWERLDKDGIRTGASGLVTLEDEGRVTLVEDGLETLSFDISKGSLVAGNTLTVNTDISGNPDPLELQITGHANTINDIYQFTVVSGGKVGHLPGPNEASLVIEWRNGVKNGSFTIEGHDPPTTPGMPVEVAVDGMNLAFHNGTLLAKDVFTITTGETGSPVFLDSSNPSPGGKSSDWHWTLDSFADQFNRQAPGLKASATFDNRLKFETSDTYYTLENIQYSQANGFNEVNCSLDVNDWGAIDFAVDDLRFVRSQGGWGVVNDPTGGTVQLLPAGGDDDGFGVDLTGDGLADMDICFTQRVSGDGFVQFDLRKQSANDIGFAFSDDAAASSGLVAAAGVNTFFKGVDAQTMAVSEDLHNTNLITSATIDSQTGHISQGDNTNALAMADVQYKEMTLRVWDYTRGNQSQSSTTTVTLDDYYNQMVSSMGIDSRSIKNSKAFADIMVNNIREQRDSISAVSLDEEMIKLIKYQHAFSAASKLLTISNEMLNTLISMR